MRDLEALKSRRILGSYGLAHLQHRLTEAEAQAKLAEHAAHACREERVVAVEHRQLLRRGAGEHLLHAGPVERLADGLRHGHRHDHADRRRLQRQPG